MFSKRCTPSRATERFGRGLLQVQGWLCFCKYCYRSKDGPVFANIVTDSRMDPFLQTLLQVQGWPRFCKYCYRSKDGSVFANIVTGPRMDPFLQILLQIQGWHRFCKYCYRSKDGSVFANIVIFAIVVKSDFKGFLLRFFISFLADFILNGVAELIQTRCVFLTNITTSLVRIWSRQDSLPPSSLLSSFL